MFKKLLAWLICTFGVFGRAILWVLQFLFYFTPLYFLPFPWWINTLIILTLMNIGAWADLLVMPLWIWAFLRVIAQPLTLSSYIFFVVAAIWLIATVHDVIAFINVYREQRKYRLFK
jgi:hypothetical protein